MELLIVIIIIGLLSAVGMVQYSKAVANAQNAQAKGVLAEMRKAALAYNSVNGVWPPTAADPVVLSVDLDGDGVNDITFRAPTGNDVPHAYGTDANGYGYGAAKRPSAVVTHWRIMYASGTISSY